MVNKWLLCGGDAGWTMGADLIYLRKTTKDSMYIL